MRKISIFICVLFCLMLVAMWPLQAQDRSRIAEQLRSDPRLYKSLIDDDDNYTNVGNIRLTITNYGTFGDGFITQTPVDQPSCEYPKGSGIEHLFVGGLWIGGETSQGVRVTTGAFNIASLSGGAGAANFEFTNTADLNDLILERSSLPENPFFSPEAVSHQDFVADFVDTNTFIPGTSIQIPNHNPLGLGVHMETYAWNFPFADDFVIFNYTITNLSNEAITNAYVGLWADLVVRNTNNISPRVGGPFYQDVGVGFMNNDTAQMVYAFEYGVNNYSNADSYIGLVLLGAETPPVVQYQKEMINNWWLFSGGNSDWERAPVDEASKYQRMSEAISNEALDNQPGNYMNLISTGPFSEIPAGESINVVFAVVCGRKNGNDPPRFDTPFQRQNLLENVSWAQRAYYGEDSNRNGQLDYVGTDSTEDVNNNGQLDRYILPTPPVNPRLKAVPGNRKVTLMWNDASESSIDLISKQRDFEGYRIYRSFLGGEFAGQGLLANMELIAEYDLIDGRFYDSGLEPVRLDEPITEITINPQTGLPDTIVYRYQLEIDNLLNGWQYAFAVTAFDSGDVKLNLPSLESSRLQNAVIVSPGTPPRTAESREIGVYPNPYRINAMWDGRLERQRKLYFNNLPLRCEVRIYTLAGDQVGGFTHDGSQYKGTDIEWYRQFSEGQTIFAGGEHAWDMVTEADQAIATGLYLFTVKDLDTGEIFKGKFVVIK